MLEHKHLSGAELKFDDTLGTFEGVLSTYGNRDNVGDVCVAGCFDESVRNKGNKRPLLWSHNWNEPIGTITITGTKKDLSVSGSFNMEVQRAKEAYALLKRGDVTGMSIGYITEDYKFEKDGTRKLTKVDLWEGSIVTFPANPQAQARAKSVDAKTQTDVRMKFCATEEVAALADDVRDLMLKALDKAFNTDDSADKTTVPDNTASKSADIGPAIAELRDTLRYGRETK